MTENSGAALTAAHIATALVTACRHYGLDPARAFESGHGPVGRRAFGPYGARILAAAGLRARLGVPGATLARLLKVASSDLTPSALTRRGITTDDLLSVAEALEAVQPAHEQGPVRGGRFRQTAETPAAPVAPAKPVPPARRAGPGWSKAAAKPSSKSSSKPGAPIARIERVKAVTPDIVRWTRQQLGLGADLDFVAECFGVDAEALAEAMRPQAVAA